MVPVGRHVRPQPFLQIRRHGQVSIIALWWYMLNRLIHHAYLFNLKEDSYRLNDALHSPDVREVEGPARG